MIQASDIDGGEIPEAGFPLANIFARRDFFPLSLSFRLKPSGTNEVETKEKSRFARKYSLVENRLKGTVLQSRKPSKFRWRRFHISRCKKRCQVSDIEE